jgi:hypothetical protein
MVPVQVHPGPPRGQVHLQEVGHQRLGATQREQVLPGGLLQNYLQNSLKPTASILGRVSPSSRDKEVICSLRSNSFGYTLLVTFNEEDMSWLLSRLP